MVVNQPYVLFHAWKIFWGWIRIREVNWRPTTLRLRQWTRIASSEAISKIQSETSVAKTVEKFCWMESVALIPWRPQVLLSWPRDWMIISWGLRHFISEAGLRNSCLPYFTIYRHLFQMQKHSRNKTFIQPRRNDGGPDKGQGVAAKGQQLTPLEINIK